MESSVTSQISPKLYSGDIKKLYKDDVDAQSELFEINIFNHTLHIAPGKSIADEEHDKLVYFYVYAIKDEKVIANLGVYELLTDEQKLMYDISSFENLLLFDYYYTNPGVIKEFEITGKNNIFDYIDTHLTPDPKFVEIYNTFTRYGKENKEFLGKHYASYKKIISILSKDIKKGLGGKIMELKDNCKNVDIYKLTLAILEPFYNVHFSLVDEGVSVTNFRDKTPPQTFTPKQYIIASTDQSFVSTASTEPGDGGGAEGGGAEGGGAEGAEDGGGGAEDLEDGEIDEGVAKVDLGTESLGGVVASEADSSASALEKEGGDVFESKPKIRAPSGSRVPGLKTKNAASASGEAAEPKPRSRSTISKSSKSEKSEKSNAKSEAKADPNAEFKAEFKSKISTLRTVPEAKESVNSVGSKGITLKEPSQVAEPKRSKIPPPPSTPPPASGSAASGSAAASATSVVSKRKPIPPPPSSPPPRSKIGFKSNS